MNVLTHILLMLTRPYPKIPTGAQVDEPDIAYFRAARIDVDSEPPSLVETDGDPLGTTLQALKSSRAQKE